MKKNFYSNCSFDSYIQLFMATTEDNCIGSKMQNSVCLYIGDYILRQPVNGKAISRRWRTLYAL